MNDVALTVNKTLMKLATMIPNLHYIGHPHFGHADVQKFEDSPEHCLLARDGLHLSYKGMFHYIQHKIFFLIYVSVILFFRDLGFYQKYIIQFILFFYF